MKLLFIQALLIAIWTGIAGIDQFSVQTHIHRPLVTGAVIGFILGDVQTGLITGATLELIWMGLAPIGGAQPPNVVIGGVIGTAFAILLKQDPQVAISVAVPFAIAVQGAITLLFTVYSPVMHSLDRFAEQGRIRAVKLASLSQLPILFIFNFIIAFIPIYFGAEAAASAIAKLPAWFLDGLGVAGGMMPAIGFALLLNIMLKKNYFPFLLVGFVLVTYFDITLIGVALLAVAIAMYDFFKGKRDQGKKEVPANGI